MPPGAHPAQVSVSDFSEPAQGDEVVLAKGAEPVPQLTPRAVVWGGILGCVLGVSNLYLGLVMGAAVGVGLMAAFVALPVHRLLGRLAPRVFGPELSLLEGCVLQTTASAAGYATVSSLPSVAVAWLMREGQPLPLGTLLAWTLCTSLLGAFFGLSLQRRFLRSRGLAFPASVGTAATLRALHAREGSAPQVRALGAATTGASLLVVLRDALGWVPGLLELPGAFRGLPLARLMPLPIEAASMAIGALMGPRVASSMLLGAAVCYGVLVPELVTSGVLSPADFDHPIRHTAWAGTVLLVSAAVVRLLLQAGLLLRSRSPGSHENPGLEQGSPMELLPRSWFWIGTGSLVVAAVGVAHAGFGIPWHQSLLAMGLSLALTALACRVIAETGAPPDTAVNQLMCGLLTRGGPSANLVHSSLAFNSSAVGADLLGNLKTAQLLGAGARQQLIAQLTGCVLGVLVLVPVFRLLLPDASSLAEAGGRFAAPAAQQVSVLADMLGHGLRGLSPTEYWSVLLAAGAGALLAIAEALLPERLARLVPSPMGMGLAFLLPPFISLYACAGGLMAWAVARRRPEAAEQWVLPAACGLLAVESLVMAGRAMFATLVGA